MSSIAFDFNSLQIKTTPTYAKHRLNPMKFISENNLDANPPYSNYNPLSILKDIFKNVNYKIIPSLIQKKKKRLGLVSSGLKETIQPRNTNKHTALIKNRMIHKKIAATPNILAPTFKHIEYVEPNHMKLYNNFITIQKMKLISKFVDINDNISNPFRSPKFKSICSTRTASRNCMYILLSEKQRIHQ